MDKFTAILIFLGLLILFLIGSAIADLVIIGESNNISYSHDKSCGMDLKNTNETKITLEKELLSQWNWRYDKSGMSVEQICGTSYQHDATFYVGGVLTSYSFERFIIPYVYIYDTKIYDCHNDHIYTIKTGSVWDIVVNEMKINVALTIQNSSGSVICYASGTNFINNNFDIIEASSGITIANLERDYFDVPQKWVFTTLNNRTFGDSEATDLRWMVLLGGKISFSDSGKKTDGCNNFVFGTGYTWVLLLLLLFLGILYCYKSSIYLCISNIASCNCASSKSSEFVDESDKSIII